MQNQNRRKLERQINPLIILCDLGVGGERGRVFDENGAIGALSSTDYKDAPKVLIRSKPKLTEPTGGAIVLLGNYHNSNHDASRVVSENGIAPTVKENHGTVTAVIVKHVRNDCDEQQSI